MTRCELIVVGAGSAGCLLASRLGRAGCHVTLIEPPSGEAAVEDRLRPARWLQLLGSAEDWNLATARSPQLAGRSLRWPRGRGLGGSSRINAMIWFPPGEQDFRRLYQAGGASWQPTDLMRAAAELETIVQPERPRWLSEASRRFLAATANWQGAEPVAYRRLNRSGRRWSPATLIGDAAAGRQPGRGSITIVRATVDRLRIEGDNVIGVELQSGSGCETLLAERGIVLAAGAIGTPGILLLSGVGPAETLSRANITVRSESPAIGSNLQDHLIMPVIFSLPPQQRFECVSSTAALAAWQHVGTGPLTSNLAECGGLFEARRLQIHVTPTHYLRHPDPDAPAAMTIGVNVCQPQSRGHLTIHRDGGDWVMQIEPDYLTAASDLDATIEGVRLVRRIAESSPLADWQRGELLPGQRKQDDAALARSIARYAQTLYHPVGTCPLGQDAQAAVDPNFRVRGLNRLWAVDASVLPTITTGNPNATVMTLALLASERILGVV